MYRKLIILILLGDIMAEQLSVGNFIVEAGRCTF